MSQQNHNRHKQSTQTDQAKRDEKRFQRRSYVLIISLMVFLVIYYFLQPKTIGHDSRYEIWIVWLPIITGMLVLGIRRRVFLLTQLRAEKGVLFKLVRACFYLLQGIIFSYLSFGQLAEVGWDTINYMRAKDSAPVKFECKVTRFYASGKSSQMEFTFNGSYEHFNMTKSTISVYYGKNPNNYLVNIEAQKGIWNYYVVKDWEIKRK